MHQRIDALERERTRRSRTRAQPSPPASSPSNRPGRRNTPRKFASWNSAPSELSAQFEQHAQETIGDLSQKARVKIAKTSREFQEAVEAAIDAAAARTLRAATPEARPKARACASKNIRQPATVRRISRTACSKWTPVPQDAGGRVRRRRSAAARRRPRRAPSVSFRQGPSFDGSFREINLIGQRAEEACEQVDKFLDSAALAEVERIRIVHGHGMGILKRAIADLLERNPHVEKFYVAPPEEGGSGATIVELKT